MKERVFDKPRITSTVIISIFVLITLVPTIYLLPLSWAAIKAAADAAEKGGAAVVFAGAIVIIMAMIAEAAIIVANAICLPFSIANRKSTIPSVRILSYVIDGVSGALLITAIIKLILFICGI